MENDFFHFFIDQPASWETTTELVDIRGWIADKNGGELTDIRALVDGRITYGIMGYDRPDIMVFMGGMPAALRAGFWIRLRPWQTAQTVVLQVLRAGTDWTEFFRTTIKASGPIPRQAPVPELATSLVAESLHYLYRHFHFEPGEVLDREADRVIADLTASSTRMTPQNDLIGHLDIPRDWINAHYDKFRVSGWLFSKDRQIARVLATIGIQNESRLIWGKERDDILRHHPEYPPHARFSSFYGLVDVRPENFSPACLKIFVEYPDGPRQLFWAQRIHLNKIDEHTGPIPIFSNRLFARTVWALLRGALQGRYRVESWRGFWQEMRTTRAKLAETMIRQKDKPAPPVPWQAQDPYTLWTRHNALTPRLARCLEAEARAIAPGPKISLVVPAYNTPARYLTELLDSVRGQFYPNWELCVADDASPQGHVRTMLAAAAAADPRIKFVVRERNGHIAQATNSALDLATGDYVALLDHDDLLPHDALLHVAQAIQRHPTAGYLYTDEDKIDDQGRRYDPQMKGGWSPEMAITHNYTHHLSVIRRDIVEAVGRLRPECNGAQDIDLFLRCFERIPARDVVHVPFIGYHWRAHAESTASRGDQKAYLFEAARRAIAEAVARRGLRAEPFLPPLMREFSLCLHQLRWDTALLAENPVTIVIPTRDRPELLEACVASLDRTIDWSHVRLVIVDDGSKEAKTRDLLAALEARPDRRCRVIRTNAEGGPFNYSRLVNLGTAAAETPLVLHLNNDIEALERGWLEDMVGWLSLAEVGVVGARLVRRDGMLDHAGIGIDRAGGLPATLFAGLPRDDFGFFFLPHCARNTAAVTGACLLTRTELYRRLGGFDETDFRVAYNDVDYCLRAAAAGYRTVYTPQATLVHLGSASRGRSYTEQEHLAFVRRYANYRDPFLSEALEPAGASFRVNPGDHRYARRPLGLRVTVVTHNLNLEGAPLFIFEYARHLAAQPGWSVQVLSPQEGPLRKKYEDAGLAVEVLDVAGVLEAPDAAAFAARLRRLADGRDWSGVDLFVGNTMLSYWIVPLAQLLNKPTALYIHESNSPQKFFSTHRLAAPGVIPVIEQAIEEAGRVVFTARSTREFFENLNQRDHFRTLPSWVDIERIERFAAAQDKRALRRKHGLDPDATLVVNIGSVCQRKGQHIFIRGVHQLMQRHGAELARHGRLEFIMVGAREGLYLETIQQDLNLMELHNTRLVPETLDIYDWYRLADVFVCTSFEESFPRVLLESAAFKIPIVSTNVNGIPEMLVNNDEAYLIPAGDYHKLATALKSCLDRLHAGDTKMVSMAFARVSRYYDARVSLERHVALAREAYFS